MLAVRCLIAAALLQLAGNASHASWMILLRCSGGRLHTVVGALCGCEESWRSVPPASCLADAWHAAQSQVPARPGLWLHQTHLWLCWEQLCAGLLALCSAPFAVPARLSDQDSAAGCPDRQQQDQQQQRTLLEVCRPAVLSD